MNAISTDIPHKWIVLFARADWLARRWLAKYYSPPSSRYIFSNKVTLWGASYSASVIYTKIIIHLSVAARQISTTIHLHFGEQLLIITEKEIFQKQLYKLYWQDFKSFSSQLFCSCTSSYWLIFFIRTDFLMLPCICDRISDNNECLIGTHNCHDVAECTNTNGSFYCNCTAGFVGNGTFCQGIRNVATFCVIKLITHLIFL